LDNMSENVLKVDNLKTYFYNEPGVVQAVDDVSFDITAGETLGVVGESGCGKSITSLSVMNLVPQPRGKIEGGTINYFKNSSAPINIASLKRNGPQMKDLRGNEIAMIFQEPMTSLTPVYTVGAQIMEAILLHQDVSKKEARSRAIDMLKKVGIAAPEQRVDSYPHELSGGMRQRVMIGMALSCNPSLLIADEPTTALDVTIESKILDLMNDLQDEFGMSIMFITHDLGVIGEMADRVIVMYMGKIVEKAPVDDIFYDPKHPYTRGLLTSIPHIGVKKRLSAIEGSVPSPYNLPPGCYFEPRCPEAKPICSQEDPALLTLEDGRQVKCVLYK